MSKIGIDIEKAKYFLQNGGLVGIPTETVYGLAANALNEEAVLHIFKAKNRPHFNPLILHTNSIEKVQSLVTEFPTWAETLANRFWPGPLTLLLPRKKNIPDLVCAGLSHIAVRIPNHPLTLQLLADLNFPLAAPSANPFGYVSPTTASHVLSQLEESVDYILDGGPSEIGLESTILGKEEGEDRIIVYRLGGLSLEELGQGFLLKINTSSNPLAPGALKSHYAPKKKLETGKMDELIKIYEGKKLGIICFEKNWEVKEAISLVLSSKGDLSEAARNLFSTIRKLDQTDVDIILVEEHPDSFLGRAINDRLRRAASKED